MRRIAVLDAPSNLGLRPPSASSVPGCAKAPGALRDQGLITRLRARDAGCVTPPRFDPGEWRPGDGVCHAGEIVHYSRKLADRICAILDAGEFPVVLGGDCSILIGSALAMRRRAIEDELPYGLVYIDGQPDLTDLEGLRPYIRDTDVVLLGIRPHDDYRLDLQASGITMRAVPQLRAEGAGRTAQWARDQLGDCLGFWVHVDVDVLDPAVMPAVDAPSAGGIAYTELELLIAGLVAAPACVGIEITVFDPDYDPDGVYARDIADTIVAGLSPLVHDEAPASEESGMVEESVALANGAPASAPPGTPIVMPAQRSAPTEVDAG